MPIILIPIILFLLYQVERWVFGRYWERNLEVELKFDKNAVVEGEKASLTEVVTNRNFIPLHILQVNFQTDTGLVFEDETNSSITDRVNVIDVFSLRFYSRITRRLPMACPRRGYYSILQTSLNASDFFSPDIHYALRKQRTSLYVYPRLIPFAKIEPLLQQLCGQAVTRRILYEDNFTFRGIREYVPTDPMGNINWKATARTGQVKVNIHDYTASPEVTLVLNVEPPRILFETELLEDSIRICMSLAEGLIREGVPVSLLTNGKDKVTGETVMLSSGASGDHITSFLRALARIDLSKETEDMSGLMEHFLKREENERTTYCFISTSRRDSAELAAGSICDKKGGLLWICPLTRDMESEAPGDKRIDFRVFIHE
ncbi:DUF58 domain-containing protein [Butyrivibrio sp. MC2021]|uniref:DUF58 domain-containing protein n=1 Tax=Butyrivibrio sp. MC2021 TaxID=1408306 RepID=UPI00047D98B8|nr:DUF58 domain-containing protein [Butyrivibrio sp. MC2021]